MSGNGVVDTEQAAMRQLLEQRQARERTCQEEVLKVLEKHNCTILPRVDILGDRITAGIQIVANQKQQE